MRRCRAVVAGHPATGPSAGRRRRRGRGAARVVAAPRRHDHPRVGQHDQLAGPGRRRAGRGGRVVTPLATMVGRHRRLLLLRAGRRVELPARHPGASPPALGRRDRRPSTRDGDHELSVGARRPRDRVPRDLDLPVAADAPRRVAPLAAARGVRRRHPAHGTVAPPRRRALAHRCARRGVRGDVLARVGHPRIPVGGPPPSAAAGRRRARGARGFGPRAVSGGDATHRAPHAA